jgi:hypothetical protein
VPQVGGHGLAVAVRGLIVMFVFVVGHRGDFGLADFEGLRNSGKGLGRVCVLTGEPWQV